MTDRDSRSATTGTAAEVKRSPAPTPNRTPAASVIGRVRQMVTAGTEVIISVLVALAFFAVFMLAMSALIPSGLTMHELMQPGSQGDGGRHIFTASLQDLGNLGDKLNPAAAMLTVLNTQVMRKDADGIVWGAVPSGTPLHEGDAVQTTRGGTAMLTFSKGQRMQLEQNSLMIVRASRSEVETVNPPTSVHVEMGELWGNVASEGEDHSAVQVSSPGAETSVSPAGAGPAQFRVAVGKNQRSIVSVYHGSADVVSLGRTVHVGANQFITVDSLRGATAPATLPDAPTLLGPAGGATFSYRELSPQVTFRWNTVPGADGYRLRVSRSPEFQGVVIDQRLAATDFVYGNFKSGPYYWRVSALHAGAEGAPSQPRTVVVSSVQRQPGLKVDFPASVVNGSECIVRGITDPGIRIIVAGEKAVIDGSGKFERTVKLKRGFNVVVVEAIDRVGNSAYKSKVIEAKF